MQMEDAKMRPASVGMDMKGMADSTVLVGVTIHVKQTYNYINCL